MQKARVSIGKPSTHEENSSPPVTDPYPQPRLETTLLVKVSETEYISEFCVSSFVEWNYMCHLWVNFIFELAPKQSTHLARIQA